MQDDKPDAPIQLFSTLAVKGALERRVLPSFRKEYAGEVHATFKPTAVLLDQVRAGARPDVLVITTEAIIDLTARGVLDRLSRVPVAVAGVGLAVKSGRPRPDISTVDALVQTLLDAKSVAFSRTGASGKYFAELLSRLGIADSVGRRATIVHQGFTASEVTAGRADVAVQQLSELMLITGVDVVGPLPDEVQHRTEFSAAGSAITAHQPAISTLLAALTSADARAAYLESGLEVPSR